MMVNKKAFLMKMVLLLNPSRRLNPTLLLEEKPSLPKSNKPTIPKMKVKKIMVTKISQLPKPNL